MNAEHIKYRIGRNLDAIFCTSQLLFFDPAIDVLTFDRIQEELADNPIQPIADEDYSILILTRDTFRFSVQTSGGLRVEFDEKDSEIRENLKRIAVSVTERFLNDGVAEVLVESILPELRLVRSSDGENYLSIGRISRADDLIKVHRRDGRQVTFSIEAWLNED